MSQGKFGRLLAEEKRRLEKSIETLGAAGLDRSLGDSISEGTVYDNHPADIGTETFEREKDFGFREDQTAALGLVEQALLRLEDGTYGACERCGQAVPEARLEAVPWTPFCLRCEATIEQEEARGGRRPESDPTGRVEDDGESARPAHPPAGRPESTAVEGGGRSRRTRERKRRPGR